MALKNLRAIPATFAEKDHTRLREDADRSGTGTPRSEIIRRRCGILWELPEAALEQVRKYAAEVGISEEEAVTRLAEVGAALVDVATRRSLRR
jgi:hypothetical protein